MNFDHFLLTQFNLRQFPNAGERDDEAWINWTRDRIELFKEYCLPSVLNQTSKNFTWLLYFDTQTPEEFKGLIEELNQHEFISVCYSDGVVDFFANYMNEVHKRSTKAEWIICSRMDNDDSLGRRAIESIQKHIILKDDFIVSIASGYVLDLESKKLSHYYYPMSPFLSLVSKNEENAKGIFHTEHTKWKQLKLFVFKEIWLELFARKKRIRRFLVKEPLWIQTFHGENVSNSFHRGFPVLKKRNLSSFGLDVNAAPSSFSEIGKYANYVLWKHYIRGMFAKLLIRK